MFDELSDYFGVIDSQRHFPSYFSSFLSVLALGPTVILRVYSATATKSKMASPKFKKSF